MAQNADDFVERINLNTLEKDLFYLASEKCQGRETGSEGQQIAAQYIIERIQELGIEPILEISDEDEIGAGYMQKVPLARTSLDEITCSFNDKEFTFLEDFYCYKNVNAGNLEASQVVFLGYGLDEKKYSDLSGMDIEGKIVLINGASPSEKILKKIKKKNRKDAVKLSKRIKNVQMLNPKAIFVVSKNVEKTTKMYGKYFKRPSMALDKNKKEQKEKASIFYISEKMAKSLIPWEKNIKTLNSTAKSNSKSLQAHIEMSVSKKIEKFHSNNILAFIPGTEFPDEVVILSAHYDHLGMKGDDIYFGADDNGSGTVSLLALMQAFKMAAEEKAPLRSMLFLWMTGEEKGLLGSEYYVENPVFPLENTVADLNIDMIGRTDKNHPDDPEYVYIIGSDKLSTKLHETNENANKKVGLELDYTYNDENDPNRFYYRSDHYNFAKNNIPVVFYFSGVHKDYHKPTDTPDKIMFGKMGKILQLVFYTAWDLANMEERIQVDVKQ